MCFSASFFAARCSPLALGHWLPTFRAMVAFSPPKNSHSRSTSRKMPAHVGAGVPANMNTHRGLSPRGYDFAEAERVLYDAYGRQTVLANNGVVAYKPSDYGQFVGFTGRYHDWETGLEYFRARYFDLALGRFINRDPAGYVNGSSLYNGYFVPNGVDPTGLYDEAGHFYTTYYVAIAAGMSPQRAVDLAYWSQYPDEDAQYDAMKASPEMASDIKKYLHSLTGGDPEKLRKYLACLLKNPAFTEVGRGLLIHALGDAYSHTYLADAIVPTNGPYFPTGPYMPMRKEETLYGPSPFLFGFNIGHLTSGHTPDYIASNPKNYGAYVDKLYENLKAMNGGAAAHPEMLDALKNVANGFQKPGVYDYFSDTYDNNQNLIESKALRDILGGYKGPYKPETGALVVPRMKIDPATMQNFMNAIKNGVKGCPCP